MREVVTMTDTPPKPKCRRWRWLVASGITAPIIRLLLILALGSLQPGYSQATGFISELGGRDAPHMTIFNSGIILVGVMLFLFSFTFSSIVSRNWRTIAGQVALATSGVGFIAIGLTPIDPIGQVEMTSIMRAHLIAGLVAMTAQTLAPALIGIGQLRNAGFRTYSIMSLVLAIVAASALTVLFSGSPIPGAFQKLFQGAADLWVFLSAFFLLHRLGQSSE